MKLTNKGLTLIELMISVSILGIILGIAIPSYLESKEASESNSAESDIKAIEDAIEQFQIENPGQLPNSLSDIGMANLVDPWGNPYQYLNIGNTKGKGKLRKDHNLVPINTDYDLYSLGPDGKSSSPLTAKSSRDDIIRAGNGQYIGIAAEF